MPDSEIYFNINEGIRQTHSLSLTQLMYDFWIGMVKRGVRVKSCIPIMTMNMAKNNEKM